MNPRPARTLALLALPLLLAGCATTAETVNYTAPDAGFTAVSATVAGATKGKQSVWIQNRDQAEAVAQKVRALVQGKTIGADTAVQVALLNNRGLQAAYTAVGISAAEAWQQTLLPNPKVSIGVFGIASPELGAFRAIEGMIATNILALLTMPGQVDLADTEFRKAQLVAAEETLRVATATRQAWIRAVAAFETTAMLSQAQIAADSASELAQKLGESGALPKAGQAREHAFNAELAGQRAAARLAAKLAKEDLTRLMGLWGEDTDYFVPNALPTLPKAPTRKDRIEAEALNRRVDLQIAKLDLEATAKRYRLTEATRYLTDLEIIAGVEAEREIETEYELDNGKLHEEKNRKTVITPQLELEFVIPVFDSGAARKRKAELAYMQAANLVAERAVNIRSEARAAYLAYRAGYDIARHYRNSVLPLRMTIEEEALLTYNGMITNTFELLADTRAKVNTLLMAVDAKRDFWLADAGLSAALYGGGAPTVSTGGTVAVADAGGGH